MNSLMGHSFRSIIVSLATFDALCTLNAEEEKKEADAIEWSLHWVRVIVFFHAIGGSVNNLPILYVSLIRRDYSKLNIKLTQRMNDEGFSD